MASWRRQKAATGPIVVPDRDVLIGLNGDPQRVSDPVSHSKFAANNNMPLLYGIEGLIDEVMIYDRALSAGEIASRSRSLPAGGRWPGRTWSKASCPARLTASRRRSSARPAGR